MTYMNTGKNDDDPVWNGLMFCIVLLHTGLLFVKSRRNQFIIHSKRIAFNI